MYSNDRNKSEKYSYTLDDLLVSCTFKDLQSNCNKQHFVVSNGTSLSKFWNTKYYTFNSGKYENGTTYENKLWRPDQRFSGLTLELFLGIPTDTDCLQTDGLSIFIHNQSTTNPQYEVFASAVGGTHTTFLINRNFITKLEKPYGNCVKDLTSNSEFHSTTFDFIVRKRNEMYTEKYCFHLCQQLKIFDKCKCLHIDLPPIEMANISDCMDTSECDSTLSVGSYRDGVYQDCQTECPFECESVQYDITSHIAQYPTKLKIDDDSPGRLIGLRNWSNERNLNISDEEMLRSFLRLDFHYSSMQYTKTVQKVKISLNELIGSIGGTMGFCIGFSILSGIEVLEFFYGLIKICIFSKK